MNDMGWNDTRYARDLVDPGRGARSRRVVGDTRCVNEQRDRGGAR